VGDHGGAVLGDLHVQLQGADPELERIAEGAEGVLRAQSQAAPVGLEVEAALTVGCRRHGGVPGPGVGDVEAEREDAGERGGHHGGGAATRHGIDPSTRLTAWNGRVPAVLRRILPVCCGADAGREWRRREAVVASDRRRRITTIEIWAPLSPSSRRLALTPATTFPLVLVWSRSGSEFGPPSPSDLRRGTGPRPRAFVAERVGSTWTGTFASPSSATRTQVLAGVAPREGLATAVILSLGSRLYATNET
jgi:hypothetical protein